ncbi:MAG: hypothetical protein ACLFTB_02930 [Desulfovibrionales bacterium]
MSKVTDLSKTIGSGITALDWDDRSTRSGEMGVLVSVSGFETSTILRHIAGRIPRHRNNGQCRVSPHF